MFFRAARITPAALFFVYCIPTSDRVNNTPEAGFQCATGTGGAALIHGAAITAGKG